MPILRLHIYQPQAHYRVPFTYQRRHTYPIPPYSTVIGFLCNACGVDDQDKDLYKEVIKKLKISIAGKFKVKNTEMIWFRNLSRNAHEGSYGSVDIREKNGNIGHIGGQSPIHIDVLENVELFIYLYHQEIDKLKELKEELKNPLNRLQVLHMGRAEDWIVYKSDPKILYENKDLIIARRDANYGYFFWIPKRIFFPGITQITILGNNCSEQNLPEGNNNQFVNFDNVDGNLYRLTTFSNIENYDNHHNHTGRRIYNYMEAKLNDGKIFGYNLFIDKEFNLPIFLGDL